MVHADQHAIKREREFLTETADCNLAFVEEMFTESVPEYLELKAFIHEHGWKTMIGDGENKRRPAEMKSWVDAGAVDILQGDMNQFGFEDIRAEAELGPTDRVKVAPHNWGSLFGFYLQLHAGRAIPNFYMAEQDLMTCKAVSTDGFEIRNGQCTLPAARGLGLTIDDARLADVACVHFDYRA